MMQSARSKVAEPLPGNRRVPPKNQHELGARGLVAVTFHFQAVFGLRSPPNEESYYVARPGGGRFVVFGQRFQRFGV